MPLDINVDIHTTNDCRTLVIEDKTGNFAEDNLGGWGNFNADPSTLGLIITIQIYYEVEEDSIVTYEADYIYQGAINSGDEAEIEFPLASSIKDFKFAINVENLLNSFSSSSDDMAIPEDLSELPDAIYQIGISTFQVGGYSPQPLSSNSFVFKNTCLTSKLVSKALTSVNLQCEDCDDRDLDKVLLAKSLLESLENL
tara:strand:+ start:3079 stop:3672 length:594 start_codon:yes stop_codon:yes gene_type:complete